MLINIITLIGFGLLFHYNFSISTIVTSTYSSHNWLPWKFEASPRNWWKQRSNQLQYMEWLRREVLGTQLEDLYKLTLQILIDNYGAYVRFTKIVTFTYVFQLQEDLWLTCIKDQ